MYIFVFNNVHHATNNAVTIIPAGVPSDNTSVTSATEMKCELDTFKTVVFCSTSAESRGKVVHVSPSTRKIAMHVCQLTRYW